MIPARPVLAGGVSFQRFGARLMTRNSVLGRLLFTVGLCSFTALALAASASDTQPAGAAAAATPSTKSDNKSLHHTDAKSDDPKGPPPAIDDHFGFLNYYCGKCHNTTDWAGGVAFDVMDAEGIPDDAETWEHAVRKLRGQLMPPAGNRQPPKDARLGFISYMEGELDKA